MADSGNAVYFARFNCRELEPACKASQAALFAGDSKQHVDCGVEVRTSIGNVFDRRPKLWVGLNAAFDFLTWTRFFVFPHEKILSLQHPLRILVQRQARQAYDFPKLLADVVDFHL